jgi:hypothetical protein
MDEDLFEFAKDNDLTFDEAEAIQEIADELGLDLEDARELQ